MGNQRDAVTLVSHSPFLLLVIRNPHFTPRCRCQRDRMGFTLRSGSVSSELLREFAIS